MKLAPDFFSLFNATAPLLDADPSLFCVSSWNDHGQARFVRDPLRLLRSDFFPGLGWMLTRAVWDDIKCAVRRLPTPPQAVPQVPTSALAAAGFCCAPCRSQRAVRCAAQLLPVPKILACSAGRPGRGATGTTGCGWGAVAQGGGSACAPRCAARTTLGRSAARGGKVTSAPTCSTRRWERGARGLWAAQDLGYLEPARCESRWQARHPAVVARTPLVVVVGACACVLSIRAGRCLEPAVVCFRAPGQRHQLGSTAPPSAADGLACQRQ